MADKNDKQAPKEEICQLIVTGADGTQRVVREWKMSTAPPQPGMWDEDEYTSDKLAPVKK